MFLHRLSAPHIDGPPAQHDYKGLLFSIPYRSLYSKDIDNLLMAGRDISASHVAMSATRVMLTCAVIGQASGTAAAMCARHDTTPRGIYRDQLEELQQQLLKDGAYLIDLPNRDPNDLARAAAVTASSERVRDGGEVMAAGNVINGHARAAGGKTNAWGPDGDDSAAPWIALEWEQPRWFNVMHVTFLTKNHAAGRFAVAAWLDDAWQTVAEVGQNKHRRHVLSFPRISTSKLRVVLLEVPPGEVGVCEIRGYDEPERVVEIAQRAARNRDLPDAGPGLPWDESVLWVTGVDPRKLPGIVLDDTQAEATGTWVRSDYSQPFVGEGYLHDGNTDQGAKSIRFTPKLPRSGRYEVRIAYPAYGNRATNTPVTIHTSRGSKAVRVNQQVTPPIDELFLSLGTFPFDARDATAGVEIRNDNADGYVVVDAVQFIRVEAGLPNP